MRSYTLFSALVGTAAAWNYNKNGEDWDALGTCNGLGVHSNQSPIDLPHQADAVEDNLYLKYPPIKSPLKFYNTGLGLAMTMPQTYKAGFGIGPSENLLADKGKVYPGEPDDGVEVFRLWQVNFHAPSEHKIAGVSYPLEMQLMHQAIDGSERMAVVSVLFNEQPGAESTIMDTLFAKGLPSQPWAEVIVNDDSANSKISNNTIMKATAGAFLAAGDDANTGQHKGLSFADAVGGAAYFRYTGSLTVPPCETNVTYLVRQTPVGISASYIQPLRELMVHLAPPSGNHREIQYLSSSKKTVSTISAVDVVTDPGMTFEPKSLPINQAAIDVAQDAMYTNLVENSPELKLALPSDTKAFGQLKMKYHSQLMSVSSLAVAARDADRNLAQVQTAYATSPGLVDKINLKWSLIAAEAGSSGSHASLGAAIGRLKVITRDLAIAYIAHLEAIGQAPPAVHKALTGVPHDPALKLKYHPVIRLPDGNEANPFAAGANKMGSATVSIGGDRNEHDKVTLQPDLKIAVNLRQPDGPPAVVAQPHLAIPRVTTTTTTTPHPSEIRLKFPIQLHQGQMEKFVEDLKFGVASALHINQTRIDIPQMRTIEMPDSIAKGHVHFEQESARPRSTSLLQPDDDAEEDVQRPMEVAVEGNDDSPVYEGDEAASDEEDWSGTVTR